MRDQWSKIMVKSSIMFLLWLVMILLGSRFGQAEGVMTARVLQYIQKLHRPI